MKTKISIKIRKRTILAAVVSILMGVGLFALDITFPVFSPASAWGKEKGSVVITPPTKAKHVDLGPYDPPVTFINQWYCTIPSLYVATYVVNKIVTSITLRVVKM